MATPFYELRERLLRAGAAPRHVKRYVRELTDHLADLRAEEERRGYSPVDAESAALVRLGAMDDLFRAMVERRHFTSWCQRAPWAMFGLLPLFSLSMAYLVACIILWSGWRLFLPGANTPFVPVNGVAVIYFGLGRLLYYSAPLIVGWWIAVVAARQRSKVLWPVAALVVLALIGGTAQVHAWSHTTTVDGGSISMNLNPGLLAQYPWQGLVHPALLLAFTLIPYLLGRFVIGGRRSIT